MDKIEKKRNKKVYIPLIIIITLVLIASVYWYREYRLYITTDDARVDTDIVSTGSKFLGRIAHLYFEEGDTVKTGSLLAELDSTDLLSQKRQAIAARDQSVANQLQSEARFAYDQENIKVQDVNFAKAKDDFDRAKSQIAGDVISKEQFDHIQKAYETSKAQLDASNVQLGVSKAQIGASVATVENSKAQIGVISQQLTNTRLYAPMNGVIAKRWLLAGDIAQPGQSIYTITQNKKLWVIVFLEETNIAKTHIGQKAIFTIDAFSGVKFSGKIFSIGANTASMFSLIPANNASGNFTKVTQRIPIKVSIESANKGDIGSYKILAGMSVVMKLEKD
jgi:membrane fusion protein (multidrug efflux system)